MKLTAPARNIGISGQNKYFPLRGPFSPLAESFLTPRAKDWRVGGATVTRWLTGMEMNFLLSQACSGGLTCPEGDQQQLFFILTGRRKPSTSDLDQVDFAAMNGFSRNLFGGVFGDYFRQSGFWMTQPDKQVALNAFINRLNLDIRLPPDDLATIADARLLNDKKNLRGLAYLRGMSAGLRFNIAKVDEVNVVAAGVGPMTSDESNAFGKAFSASKNGDTWALFEMARVQLSRNGITNY